VARIQSLWSECLENSGGPFLFGTFSIADAMFAPVVNRLDVYAFETSPSRGDYMDADEGTARLAGVGNCRPGRALGGRGG
jgi:glutathione S-transferase